MTQKEQMKLAVSCLKSAPICCNPSIISLDLEELAAYTAAVEANMRERCAESKQSELDRAKEELQEMHTYHDKAMIQISKTLGEDLSDEPRFKWVDLAASQKMRELDKANARIAQLEEALKQYIDSDETSEGGIWEEENKFWIDIKRNAQKLLAESSDTWLSEHDKAVELRVFKDIIKIESNCGWDGVLDLIEARK